jgi:hypothetical protein
MTDNPGVTVIRTPDEALDTIDRILDAEAQVGRWLALAQP